MSFLDIGIEQADFVSADSINEILVMSAAASAADEKTSSQMPRPSASRRVSSRRA